jgi:hypothetical protein
LKLIRIYFEHRSEKTLPEKKNRAYGNEVLYKIILFTKSLRAVITRPDYINLYFELLSTINEFLNDVQEYQVVKEAVNKGLFDIFKDILLMYSTNRELYKYKNFRKPELEKLNKFEIDRVTFYALSILNKIFALKIIKTDHFVIKQFIDTIEGGIITECMYRFKELKPKKKYFFNYELTQEKVLKKSGFFQKVKIIEVFYLLMFIDTQVVALINKF